MRILFVVHEFFPAWYTGTERFVLNLCKQLQRMGHFVTVLSYAISETGNFQEYDGILFREYQYQNIPVIQVKHTVIPTDINFKIFDPHMEKIYEKIIDEGHFDVIHVGHPMRNGSLIKSAKKRNIPVVLTLTDFWLFCPRTIGLTQKNQLCCGSSDGKKCIDECFDESWDELIQNRVKDTRELLTIPKIIASPSQFLITMFEKNFPNMIQVVRHGIEYSDIKPNDTILKSKDIVIFGYFGTLVPHKGVHIITQSLKLIPYKNFKIWIYGNYFYEKQYYENLVDQVKGDDRIIFMGEYKDDELQEIMNKTNCSLCPSIWWENSPLTILTSLAYKVPVITTNIGGAAEFIKNEINGFNFYFGRPDSLANVFIEILNNPEKLNSIKNNIIRPRRIEEEAFEYEKKYIEIMAE